MLSANMKKASDSSAKKTWPARVWIVAIYGASGLLLIYRRFQTDGCFGLAIADGNIWKRTNPLFPFLTEGAVRLSASLVELIVVTYLAVSIQ